MKHITPGSPEWAAMFHHFPPHWQALMRSARAEDVNLYFLGLNTSGKELRTLLMARVLPTLVLVGDDTHASVGPKGYKAAPVLSRWATAACVHGCGAEPDFYEQLPRDARRTGGRFAFVETDAAHVPAWADLFARRGTGVQLVYPHDGLHPVLPPAAEMH